MNKFLASSVDSSKLSVTISGLIISFSSLIILVASHYGLTLGAEDVSNLATQAGLAVGAITTLYGLIRKILIAVS
jgi:hypothetical protein